MRTMTMEFHWHHSDSGMSTTLAMSVNRRMVAHQLCVSS